MSASASARDEKDEDEDVDVLDGILTSSESDGNDDDDDEDYDDDEDEEASLPPRKRKPRFPTGTGGGGGGTKRARVCARADAVARTSCEGDAEDDGKTAAAAAAATGPLTVLLVPYRSAPLQNREWQHAIFTSVMPKVLDAALGAGAWRIYIGQQSDDGHEFSRGRVLNALARQARELHGTANVRYILHDIDLLPTVPRARLYGAPWRERAFALWSDSPKYKNPRFIGGVLGIDAEAFWHVNGFHNFFRGWGGEDDALLRLLEANGVGVQRDGTVGHMTDLENEPFVVEGQKHASSLSNYDAKRRGLDRARAMGARNTDGAAALRFTVAASTELAPAVHQWTLVVFSGRDDDEHGGVTFRGRPLYARRGAHDQKTHVVQRKSSAPAPAPFPEKHLPEPCFDAADLLALCMCE